MSGQNTLTNLTNKTISEKQTIQLFPKEKKLFKKRCEGAESKNSVHNSKYDWIEFELQVWNFKWSTRLKNLNEADKHKIHFLQNLLTV